MDWFLHNPIVDMDNPLFLALYALLIAAAAIGAAVWRGSDDPTGDLAPPSVPLYPDPYEIAYLRGGANEVTRSVVFNLVQRGYLQVDLQTGRAAKRGAERMVRRAETTPDAGTLNAMERRAFEWFDETPRAPSTLFTGGLAKEIEGFCGVYEQGLIQQRMLRAPEHRFGTRQFFTAMAVIWGVGVYKLAAAALNGRANVGFLVLLAVLALIPLSIICFRPHRLTRRGQAYLEQLRVAFQPVRQGAPGNEAALQGSAPESNLALPVLVGVFGVGILGATPFYYMPQMFQRGAAVTSGTGGCGSAAASSCGSSSCSGGGGCGGGCGGGGCGGS